MTALALRQVVADALAEVGANILHMRVPKGRARTTTWIGVEHGFGIRHYPSGRNVYIVQTRMGGRLRTVTIGPAAVITLHQATIVARRVIAYAHVGLDPATERQRIRGAPSFDDFLKEYWARWAPHWKASTAEAHGIYRARYLDTAFPDIFIDALNEADVTRWFAGLNDRTGPGAANRTISILNHMMNKAEAWGYRLANTNPCRAVRRNRNNTRERFLSTAELDTLGALLAAERAAMEPVRQAAGVAISLLLLTGCRVGEILGLQWRDVRGSRLLLRDSKTGPRTVWLGDEARVLIAALPRTKTVPWLFWQQARRKPIQHLACYWNHLRDAAGLGEARMHDLRHTFASHAAMNRETLPMIGRLLGHRNAQSTARYAHLSDEHVMEAAEQIGAAIERMLR